LQEPLVFKLSLLIQPYYFFFVLGFCLELLRYYLAPKVTKNLLESRFKGIIDDTVVVLGGNLLFNAFQYQGLAKLEMQVLSVQFTSAMLGHNKVVGVFDYFSSLFFHVVHMGLIRSLTRVVLLIMLLRKTCWGGDLSGRLSRDVGRGLPHYGIQKIYSNNELQASLISLITNSKKNLLGDIEPNKKADAFFHEVLPFERNLVNISAYLIEDLPAQIFLEDSVTTSILKFRGPQIYVLSISLKR
jgi:hypothetical protein